MTAFSADCLCVDQFGQEVEMLKAGKNPDDHGAIDDYWSAYDRQKQ